MVCGPTSSWNGRTPAVTVPAFGPLGSSPRLGHGLVWAGQQGPRLLSDPFQVGHVPRTRKGRASALPPAVHRGLPLSCKPLRGTGTRLRWATSAGPSDAVKAQPELLVPVAVISFLGGNKIVPVPGPSAGRLLEHARVGTIRLPAPEVKR
jgi:hypothetical protein